LGSHRRISWQKLDLEKSGSRDVAPLEPVPVDQLRQTLEYSVELEAHYRKFVSTKPSSFALQIFYEDVFSAELDENREALSRIFSFVGLDMPQSENADKLLNPGQIKVTSCAVYRSIPKAVLID
jgi:hypothetical protein